MAMDLTPALEAQLQAALVACTIAFHARLRTCPKCQIVFLKTGKRRYCSLRCQGIHKVQAFRVRQQRRRFRRVTAPAPIQHEARLV